MTEPVMERLTACGHQWTPYDIVGCVDPKSVNGWCTLTTRACGLLCQWVPEVPDGRP